MQTYDIYVTNPARPGAKPTDLSVDDELFSHRGLRETGLPLDDAKRLLAVAKAYGANAYVVPVAYRHPAVTLAQARLTALARHSEMLAAGRRLMELDAGYDDILWWTFCADDIQALEEDRLPGRVCIAIDKLKGHVRTQDELRAWLLLSAQ